MAGHTTKSAARSLPGDKAQLGPLIEAALRHGSAAFADVVISPCVAFDEHPGSTRSNEWSNDRSNDQVREHNEAVKRIDFINPARAQGRAGARSRLELPQFERSPTRLRKLHIDFDATDRIAAQPQMLAVQALGKIAAGQLCVEPQTVDWRVALRAVAVPLKRLGEAELRSGTQTLANAKVALR